MKFIRKCDNCEKEYRADTRNTNRGWGLCCSKSCAASKREKVKPGYDPERVKANNIRRENWWGDSSEDWLYDDDMSWDAHKNHLF